MFEEKRNELINKQSELMKEIEVEQARINEYKKKLQMLVTDYNKIVAKLELLSELEKNQEINDES